MLAVSVLCWGHDCLLEAPLYMPGSCLRQCSSGWFNEYWECKKSTPTSGFFITTPWGKQAVSNYLMCVSENKRFTRSADDSDLLECTRYCPSGAFVREPLNNDPATTMLKCVQSDDNACAFYTIASNGIRECFGENATECPDKYPLVISDVDTS